MKMTFKQQSALLFLLFFSLFFAGSAIAQPFVVKGKIANTETQAGLEGLVVRLNETAYESITEEDGAFRISGIQESGNQILVVLSGTKELYRQDIRVGDTRLTDVGTIPVVLEENLPEVAVANDIIPTISLSEGDLDGEDNAQDFSGLLSASRDAFIATSGFTFGRRRFRVRGYDSENSLYYINGVPVNEMERGRIFFGSWGGLNDVTRYPEVEIGLAPVSYTFGGVGGGLHLNMRASNQRKQTRISVSETNGGYRHRVMATHSTGWLPGGWAISVSGSRRWADEGYVDGTFYDAWSYYLGVEKKFNKQHSLSLTAFGAPNKRGRSTAVVQELYDLAGTNFYNPYWGFQNGKKRNSRVGNTHQPVVILTHDWNASDKTKLTTSVNYQTGRSGSTALDWYRANDPRPDYYRKLPSYIFANSSQEVAAEEEERWRTDEAFRQVHWDDIYQINLNAPESTITDANGIAGNDITGRLAHYIVEERRYDTDKLGASINLEQVVNDEFSIQGGLNYQQNTVHAYKLVDDLLGADFYFDTDEFAERDFPGNTIFNQPNLEQTNHVAQEGDVIGYDYDSNIRNIGGWLQGQYDLGNADLFLAANVSQTQFWRTGNFRTGRFPDSSFGDSEKQDFLNVGVKGGLTYALDGRNYLFARGSYRTRAPFMRNAYMAIRTRDQLVPGLTNEKILSGEAGFIHRAPMFKARAVFYYTKFKDQTKVNSFFQDDLNIAVDTDTEITGGFVNFAMTGIDTRHMGAELAADVKIGAGLSARLVAAIGEHIYDSRPNAIMTLDNDARLLVEDRTVYLKNFYISGQPQSAYNVGLNYQAKNYWSFWLDVSYFHRLYIDPNPNRRTEAAISYDAAGIDKVEQGTALWENILYQENPDGAAMVDVSVRKSWKIGDTYLILNGSVNNLLNNTDFITGGYEQLRFDFEEKNVDRFPSRYFYGFGLSYFMNVTFRF